MTQVYLGILIDESRTDAMTQPSQDLIKGFYAKGEETVQQAIARACVAWADDKEHAQRLYDSGSMGDFMWSSPMFANAHWRNGLKGKTLTASYQFMIMKKSLIILVLKTSHVSSL